MSQSPFLIPIVIIAARLYGNFHQLSSIFFTIVGIGILKEIAC